MKSSETVFVSNFKTFTCVCLGVKHGFYNFSLCFVVFDHFNKQSQVFVRRISPGSSRPSSTNNHIKAISWTWFQSNTSYLQSSNCASLNFDYSNLTSPMINTDKLLISCKLKKSNSKTLFVSNRFEVIVKNLTRWHSLPLSADLWSLHGLFIRLSWIKNCQLFKTYNLF